MNQLITYKEAEGFLKNPPSLAPRPDFTKICTLCKHITQALKQLDCPQSLIHRWAGLPMDPAMYLLVKLTPFAAPSDPGDVPIYPQFATTQVIKTLDQLWEKKRNYYLLYIKISRACLCIIDKNINNHFKVSKHPNLSGWNPRMSPQLILAQLELSYGKPGDQLMQNNDKLFWADFLPNNALELLFHFVEQCQEVPIIVRILYTPMQVISNTVHLLLQSRIFLMKEFEDWEMTPNKMWLALKTFNHGVYAHHLMAVRLWSTSAQQGNAPTQNLYNILANGNNNTNDDAMTIMITQTAAAATMGSTLANTYATPVPAPTNLNLMLAINLLAANQQVLYQRIAPLLQHMAALSFNTQPLTLRLTFLVPHMTPFHVPPIQQLTISGLPPFNTRGFNHGHKGRNTEGRGQGGGFNWHGQGCTPFADHMAARGRGSQSGGGTPNMFPQASGFQNVNAQCMNSQYHSNVTKKINNWNVCYSCGFDVKDSHTSMICPAHLRKPTVVKGFTRANAQSYIGIGYDACAKGMHKSVLSTNAAFWQGGGENIFMANKCNSLVTANVFFFGPHQ
jgi:hypothetical protein